MIRMKRRHALLPLLLGLCSVRVAAQRPASGVPHRIGWLDAGTPATAKSAVEGLRQGLSELGYVEGRDLLIEFRWGEGRNDRLLDLATELVRANVDVIVVNGEPGIRAARQATVTTPIVMGAVGDPVGAGFAASLARPGGNITGVSNLAVEITGKWFQLLRETLPRIRHVAVLWNPANPTHHSFWREAQAAAQTVGVRVSRFDLTSPDDLENVFVRMAAEQVEGVVVLPDPLTNANRSRIAELLVAGRLPAITLFRESAEAGVLLSYGVGRFENLRRAAGYVDRIFKGAKPAEMPIEQATKFDLVVNLKTAKLLKIVIPRSLLARADEVIE